MKINVLGMDPSLRHWGLVGAALDLSDGVLYEPIGLVIEPEKDTSKQVRQNSKDLGSAEHLSRVVFEAAKKASCIFAEIPVGSQSARAMASYGVCVGILGMLKAQGYPIIEVTATENKRIFTGNPHATKRQMIDKLEELYPWMDLAKRNGKAIDKNEHIADAMASIHAGVKTNEFRTLMQIFRGKR